MQVLSASDSDSQGTPNTLVRPRYDTTHKERLHFTARRNITDRPRDITTRQRDIRRVSVISR